MLLGGDNSRAAVQPCPLNPTMGHGVRVFPTVDDDVCVQCSFSVTGLWPGVSSGFSAERGL